MVRKVILCVCWIFLSLSITFSCDSDSGTNLGINEAKKISDLTKDEFFSFCVYLGEYQLETGTAEDHCASIGLIRILQDMDSAACETAVADCLERAEANPLDIGSQCAVDLHRGWDGLFGKCDATVREMDTCLQEAKKGISGNPFDQASCSSSKEEVERAMAEALRSPERPASCEIVGDKCPMYLADID